MLPVIFFLFLFNKVYSQVENVSSDSCTNVACDSNGQVCGIRKEGEGFRLRLFADECDLKKFACDVRKPLAYEITPFYYCRQVFKPKPLEDRSCVPYDCTHTKDDVTVCAIKNQGEGFRIRLFKNKCRLWEYNCEYNENFNMTDLYVCNEFKLFESIDNSVGEVVLNLLNFDANKNKYLASTFTKNNVTGENDQADQNIDQNYQNIGKRFVSQDNEKVHNMTIDDDELYIESDSEEAELGNNNYIYDITGDINNHSVEELTNQKVDDNVTPEVLTFIDEFPETTTENVDDRNKVDEDKFKNVIVIRGSLKDFSRVNETISRFFAATHVFDLPVKEMPTEYISEDSRRRLVKIAGPIKVYKPWIVIPKNISDDFDHRPTLNSCYHKCPRKCPKTYAPVCGVPGRLAREPSLMFQNHCFMDVAQCKMFWENKSPTSLSSAYQESSFVFCLGDVMNHMYNFLPLVKTLQHMGRLPKKGRFRSRLSNLKFFNNMLAAKEPRLMG